LKAGGLLLGVFDKQQYKSETIHLERGDLLFFYTDGLNEAHTPSPDRVEFGEKRLIEFLAANRHLKANALADAVMKICAGEVRQQAIRHQYQQTLDEYMPRIEAKTATLLAASCDIGALLGGLEPAPRSHLREYGRLLGLAFQIADDVLDYTGTEDEVGKPIGHDIAEGFATLPLMLAMEEPSIAGRLSPLLRSGRKLSADGAEQVVALVRASKGPQRAIEHARSLASDARNELVTMGAGEAVQTLSALTNYVVSRKL